ncbi:amidohydrolase [Adhaeribacter pallidiroseus]|uniref:Putative amidohydrolase YtcJ n=1 Tax=Adhaeribacter pallidiroseus TaxID=2072847 RepID=A0A369QNB1_9BACT|nr:amidohydrolase [Adhaeribacter pallidiroseus]RDC63698.1 putative amidohydrolase YtcJ [Adhaeribacter pallidiroseus]
MNKRYIATCRQIFFALIFLNFSVACQSKTAVDLIVYNATVYTVNSKFEKAEAIAVKAGKLVAVGSTNDIRSQYAAQQEMDAQAQPIYPGFIDAHAHFYGYAQNLQQADLTGTNSFAQIILKLVKHRQKHPQAAWLLGRGWDQNDWLDKNFPTQDTLNKLFPDVPVFLERVDGHAALVNQKALELAGVTTQTPVTGGLIEQKNGKLTGILVDNAVELVSAKIPELTNPEKQAALLQAQQNCFAVGLTTLADAGLEKSVIDLYDSLQQQGKLKMRLYAMLNPSAANQQYYFKNGPYQTDRLHVCSFKVYADGALGSRGACLLQPYRDRPQQTGFLLRKPTDYRQLAAAIYHSGFQMNTHAIGDSANRLIATIYSEVLQNKNNRRWRIEHAQVVNPTDITKFGRYSIIPSVQPTHATSDMYWAGERLGTDRLPHAYAYKDLLKQNGTIALGSDFPVEHINPLYGFHAAVARQDAKNYPAGGFQINNALTREQALRGTTIWAAYANFEEKSRGSLEPGKFADFVILNQDIMTIPVFEIRKTQVMYTFLNGEQVYKR